jgi:hypothetical protein
MLRSLGGLAMLASGWSGCALSHEVAPRADAGRRDGGPARTDAAPHDAGRERDAGADAWLEPGEREAIVEIHPTTISAFFHESDAPRGVCAKRVDGPCEVETCELLSDIGPRDVSAGDITLQTADGTYVMRFDSSYDFISLGEPAWHLDVATDWAISAPGDLAGAFEGVVTAPASTTITSPDPSALATLDPAEDFEVRWRPAPSGELRIAFRAQRPMRPPSQALVECYFPAGAGAGVVPSSALRDLPAYATSNAVTVWFEIVGRSVALSRTHRVTITARIALGDALPTLE